MKAKYMLLWLIASLLFLSQDAISHGGGLDRSGCHHNRKTGGYHCHRGSGTDDYRSNLYGGGASGFQGGYPYGTQQFQGNAWGNVNPYVAPQIDYKEYAVRGHQNWRAFHYSQGKSSEFIRVESVENSSGNVWLGIEFVPREKCTASYALFVKMQSVYAAQMQSVGKITYKFDGGEVRSSDVTYYANAGENILRVYLNDLKGEILLRNELILRLDAHVIDKPTYRYSLRGSSSATKTGESLCKSTNSFQLN